jgi:Mrp family chromosome partitioning ATPase
LEAFRTLRANLLFACPSEVGNVVLITSPCSGDGKTTCAYSLASALARAGRSVLVIDTEPHRDSGRRLEDSEGRNDLAAILEGGVGWRTATLPVAVSPSCRFDAIRVGGSASSELLSSRAMREFIADARLSYAWVIIDAPSYSGLSDALMLSATADCVLTVLRPQHTPKRLAAENVRRLAAIPAHYALVLNDVRF